MPPTNRPTSVGFFVAGGRQGVALLPVRGLTRIPLPSLLTTGLLFNVRALSPAGSLERTLEVDG